MDCHDVVKKEIEDSATDKKHLLKENIPPMDFESSLFIKGDRRNHKAMPQHISAVVESTPKKQKSQVEDPLTPTCNFKLLINLAASSEYASNGSSKMNNENQEPSPVIFHSKEKIKRKEKSLSIICTRFLNMYPLYPSADQNISVSLDDVCFQLSIERRRLYDIVNVFESINMLNKLSKNRYRWFGKNNLYESLLKIKETAVNENTLAKLQYVLKLEEQSHEKQTCLLDDVSGFYKQFESGNSPLTFKVGNEPRREKSLAFISQRFLMMFLVSSTKVISLSVAAKVLNGFHKTDGGAQMKTQIRRLYDIANVLSSIGLISKEFVLTPNGKKPAFKYIGPDLTAPKTSNECALTTPKKVRVKSKGFTRHSSFQDICAVAELERKKLYLDDSPKSAPPFERCIRNQNKETGVTSFSNFISPFGPTVLKPKEKETNASVPEASPKTPAQAKNGTKFLPIQPNMTVVNVPKGVFAGNSPYYILSPVLTNESIQSPKPFSAVLLFTPESSSKALILNKTPCSEVSASKSSEPLNPERSSLKSIDNKLGTPLAASLNLNTQHVIPKKLDFISEPDEGVDLRSKSKDASENSREFCESPSVCSTRNSSPVSSVSRFGSPFSIPSGYVTPVPSVSLDAVFPSGVETSSILKDIEADSSDPLKTVRTLSTAEKIEIGAKGLLKSLVRDKENDPVCKLFAQGLKSSVKAKVPNSSLPLRDSSNFLIGYNSCSNDSVNSEVSEILNGKNLGESVRSKKYLELDENSISSPIKKTRKELFQATPSQLVSLPPIIPDQMFLFNSKKYQSLSVNKVVYTGPHQISFPANKNNTYTS